MKSPAIPKGRKELRIQGDGDCFYRTISLWMDRHTNVNHAQTGTMVNEAIAQHPDAFEPFLFTTKTVDDHLKKSRCNGTVEPNNKYTHTIINLVCDNDDVVDKTILSENQKIQ